MRTPCKIKTVHGRTAFTTDGVSRQQQVRKSSPASTQTTNAEGKTISHIFLPRCAPSHEARRILKRALHLLSVPFPRLAAGNLAGATPDSKGQGEAAAAAAAASVETRFGIGVGIVFRWTGGGRSSTGWWGCENASRLRRWCWRQ